MAQKVNPHSFRLGYVRSWDSRWYEKRDYAKILHEDLAIRNLLKIRLDRADVGRVEIVRFPDRVNVIVHTARPGIVIGKRGSDIEQLKRILVKMTAKQVHISIVEIKQPELISKLVSESISRQLRGKISFKRAMKQAIANVMRNGAKGVKIQCSGRLGGAEMSRVESYREGRVPLQTLRADIDYGASVAQTTYGSIGVKVWIYKGEILVSTRAADGRIIHNKNENRNENRESPSTNHGSKNRIRRSSSAQS